MVLLKRRRSRGEKVMEMVGMGRSSGKLRRKMGRGAKRRLISGQDPDSNSWQ